MFAYWIISLNSCATLIIAEMLSLVWKTMNDPLSLCSLSKKKGTILPQDSLLTLFFSDNSQIHRRELMRAQSQCYLADLGSVEQDCSEARSPWREVCGGPAKCCNASKRLRGRVYSTFTAYNDKRALFMWPCSTWNWWEGADIVHSAISLMSLLLLNAAIFPRFISITDALLTRSQTSSSQKGSFLCDLFHSVSLFSFPLKVFLLPSNSQVSQDMSAK